MLDSAAAATRPVRIALVGKYVQLEDAYKSVTEALRHSGYAHGGEIEIDWVDSEALDSDERAAELLGGADGILVPGGFGGRGIEGKIRAVRVAREHRIPYLGICLGMQMAVCEFARSVAGMPGANSTEFDIETEWPVIDLLPEQKEVADLGGTMRLGADPIKLHAGTIARELYDEAVVYERHRHRYEVSISLRKRIEAAGLVVSGTSPDERLVEVVELPRYEHPFFVASQYHPEFKSRPERPAPLFREFVGAAMQRAGRRRGARPLGRGAGQPRQRLRGRPCVPRPRSSAAVSTRPSPSCARSRARRAASVRWPTASARSCARSGSRSRRTAPRRRSVASAATCSCASTGVRRAA